MKATPKGDRKAYELAKGYLPSLNITGVTQTLIEKYLDPLSLNPKPRSKGKLYQRLLESAQSPHVQSNHRALCAWKWNEEWIILSRFLDKCLVVLQLGL